MNGVLLLETHDQREGNLCLPAEATGRITRVQVIDTRFDLDPVFRPDNAAPDEAEEVFHRLMARGAALRAESVAAIEQAHQVRARSRVLRARSAGLMRAADFFRIDQPPAGRGRGLGSCGAVSVGVRHFRSHRI